MFQSPILVYSEYCNYCATFINALVKHPKIFESFVKINIDPESSTKQRPHIFYEIQNTLNHKISRVPTIIIENGNYVLTGEEAFKWLEFEIKKSNESILSPFNPNEMGSFSDQYSKFGSTELHDASEQTFKFLSNQNDKIHTPDETSIEKRDLNSQQKERESFDNTRGEKPQMRSDQNMMRESFNQSGQGGMDYSKMMSQRQMSMQQAPRQNIDFTGSNFGFASQNGQGGQRLSHKQKEIDVKLQELMSQREEFTPTSSPSVRTEDIDWTRGTIKH